MTQDTYTKSYYGYVTVKFKWQRHRATSTFSSSSRMSNYSSGDNFFQKTKSTETKNKPFHASHPLITKNTLLFERSALFFIFFLCKYVLGKCTHCIMLFRKPINRNDTINFIISKQNLRKLTIWRIWFM